MKKIVPIIILALLAWLAISLVNKEDEVHEGVKEQVTSELEEYTQRMVGLAEKLHNDENFYTGGHVTVLIGYFELVAKTMATVNDSGESIFNEEELKKIYNTLLERVEDFREGLIDNHSPRYTLTNEDKILSMESGLINGGEMLEKYLYQTDSNDVLKNIYISWRDVDSENFRLTHNHFAEPVGAYNQNEENLTDNLSQYDIQDGQRVGNPFKKLKDTVATRYINSPIEVSRLKEVVGQKVSLHLKNNQTLEGKLLAFEEEKVKITVDMDAGSYTRTIAPQDIQSAEKITLQRIRVEAEKKPKHIEGPVNKNKKYGGKFEEMIHNPTLDPGKSAFYCFITRDHKMYVIDDLKGRLITHTRETKKGLRTEADGLESMAAGAICVTTTDKIKKYGARSGPRISEVCWAFLKENQMIVKGQIRKPDNKGNRPVFSDFRLVFNIRLVDGTPGTQYSYPVKEETLVLTNRNVIMISRIRYLDVALNYMNRSRYGKGSKPWEFEVKVN